ncbi:MAG TPA: helix-turn-helix transcriptional regulator [Candidatus Acidoferrales bacterium]|nr:helix-turn-helix transcriptional regulator [Candidatus Acidoferrales bacterium]
MDAGKPNPSAGKRLKALRESLGLTTRDVEEKSGRIAEERRNREYHISHAWVTDIENGKFTPSIYKFHTFSAVYNRRITELVSYYGLPLGDLNRYRLSIGVPKTHLLDSGSDLEVEKVSLPVEFKPEFRLERTNLLAQVVEKWNQIPVGFLQHLDLHKSVYGYIGLEDYTLYPLIRPGSLVQIDASQRKISVEKWKTEFDRPVYFVELRIGYVCSWCQVDRGQLIIIPHPHSHQDVRRFDYPAQAEIVGRVTGIAMRITAEKETRP